MNDKTIFPISTNDDGLVTTQNEQVNDLFYDYGVTFLKLAFPETPVQELEDVYFLISAGNLDDLIDEMTDFSQFSDVEKIPKLQSYYTPDDYNSTCNGNNSLWHLDKINAENAWDITKGSADIKVAVIDWYLDVEHQDFINTDGSNQIDYYYDMGTAKSYDHNLYTLPSTLPQSSANLFFNHKDGHGTRVAGCIAASSDNNNQISSIGYNSKIRFYNAGKGPLVNYNPGLVHNLYTEMILALQGMVKAALDGNDVISCSWGWNNAGDFATATVQYAVDKGCIVVFAGGQVQDGESNTSINVPSVVPGVISVTMVNQSDVLPNYAYRNPTIDLSAPGVDIVSIKYKDLCGDVSQWSSGTSFSAPIVSGAIGLVLSLNPCLNFTEVRHILRSTAVDLSAANPSVPAGHMGAGNLDAEAALNYTLANYPFNNPVTINGDITITGNVTWNNNEVVNGLITIEDGATLHIDGAKIEFTDSRKTGNRCGIMVKSGGKLIIDNSAHLTVYECERHHLWDGIVVQGEADVSGNIIRGNVTTTNAKISKAVVGIKSGSYETVSNRTTTNDDGNSIPLYTSKAFHAGDINSELTTFEDNYIGVFFNPFFDKKTTSNFTNCDFVFNNKITLLSTIQENYYDPLDHSFVKNIGNNTIEHTPIGMRGPIDPNNPGPTSGVPNINYYNNKQGNFYAFAVLSGIETIPFEGCTFKNNISSQFLPDNESVLGIGILAYNSRIKVNNDINNSDFDFLYKGIDSYDNGLGSSNLVLQNSTFSNCYKGVTINGGFGHRIKANQFLNIPTGIQSADLNNPMGGRASYTPSWGIFASSTNNTIIQDNEFTGISLAAQHKIFDITTDNIFSYGPATYGIVYNNAARFGTFANYTRGNTFDVLDIGTQAEEHNHYLDLQCNNYSNGFQDWLVAPKPSLNEKLKNQGSICNPGKTPLNEFSNACNTGTNRHIYTNINFDYYAWGTPSATVPQCFNAQINGPFPLIGVDVKSCMENNIDPVSICNLPGWTGQGWVIDVFDGDINYAVSDLNNSGGNGDEIARIINDDGNHSNEEKMLVATIAAEYWTAANDVNNLLQFYGTINFEDVTEQLITLNLVNGYINQAQTLLAQLPNNNEEEIGLKNYFTLLINLSMDNRIGWPTAAELTELFGIAEQSLHASNLSRAYLANLHKGNFNIYPQLVEGEESSAKTSLSKPSVAMKIYPNPAVNQVNVNIISKNLNDKFFNLTINNVKGQKVKQYTNLQANSLNTINIDNLASGLYVLQLFNKATGTMQSEKLIIAK